MFKWSRVNLPGGSCFIRCNPIFASVILFIYKSSHREVFLGKGVLKICIKFTGEHPCQSAISIKLYSNFIEITLCNWCSPITLLHIFRIPFLNNTSGWLLLYLGLEDSFRQLVWQLRLAVWDLWKVSTQQLHSSPLSSKIHASSPMLLLYTNVSTSLI